MSEKNENLVTVIAVIIAIIVGVILQIVYKLPIIVSVVVAVLLGVLVGFIAYIIQSIIRKKKEQVAWYKTLNEILLAKIMGVRQRIQTEFLSYSQLYI